MNNFLKDLKNRVLIYDGSKGYMLQTMGLTGGECGELWNIKQPEKVLKVHKLYHDAGSDVIQTNTFQTNRLQLKKHGLENMVYDLNYNGARLAREAVGEAGYVAACVGSIGEMFEPYGELDFETAYSAYKEQIAALVAGGADIINFETYMDIGELRVALLAAIENFNIPVICSMTFDANGRTLMGNTPQSAAIISKSLGAHMVGINCSLGPAAMVGVIQKMKEANAGYLCIKPNAGLPEVIDGVTIYKESPEVFAQSSKEFVQFGARLIGGCCGSTPEHVAAIKAAVDKLETPDIEQFDVMLNTIIASATNLLDLKSATIQNIGVMSCSKDSGLAKAVSNGNTDYISNYAMDISAGGFEAIFIDYNNEITAGIDFANLVNLTQNSVKVPLILKCPDPEALSTGLRIYKGRAAVIKSNVGSIKNSAQLVEENAIRKYGAVTMDKF